MSRLNSFDRENFTIPLIILSNLMKAIQDLTKHENFNVSQSIAFDDQVNFTYITIDHVS